jgi:hypothetical protein
MRKVRDGWEVIKKGKGKSQFYKKLTNVQIKDFRSKKYLVLESYKYYL